MIIGYFITPTSVINFTGIYFLRFIEIISEVSGRHLVQSVILLAILAANIGPIDADPEAARRMCERLGDFLRRTLALGARQAVPLGEELALVDRYLDIEQVRFGERLKVERAVDRLGMVGLIILANVNDVLLDDARFESFWAALNERRLPTLLPLPTVPRPLPPTRPRLRPRPMAASPGCR